MQSNFVNGKHIDTIDIYNRSFIFGDGIFETCKVIDGEILYFDYHQKRLKDGVKKLHLNLDYQKLLIEIEQVLANLINKNCILKIIISRGNTLFGYSYKENIESIRVIMLSSLPDNTISNVNLSFCQSGYGFNAYLSGIKHQNRLEQILARGSGDDCIMLDENNNVISTTCANIFIIKDNVIYTPKIDKCGILGTRRAVIIDNFDIIIRDINKVELFDADEIFITNSIIGIKSIDMLASKKLGNIITNRIKQQIKC